MLVESLSSYQRKLQGDTPASFMLWDRQADGKSRPRSEESLSDALKLDLADDILGRVVVANSEVVIRRGAAVDAGERTDIHVDAVTRGLRRGTFGRITVVEVKGCWNREVRTAMQEQHHERYLAAGGCRYGLAGGCRYGLYVGACFPVEQWNEGDYRRGNARRLLPPTLGEARSLFRAQAEELSAGDHRVVAVVLDCTLS